MFMKKIFLKIWNALEKRNIYYETPITDRSMQNIDIFYIDRIESKFKTAVCEIINYR